MIENFNEWHASIGGYLLGVGIEGRPDCRGVLPPFHLNKCFEHHKFTQNYQTLGTWDTVDFVESTMTALVFPSQIRVEYMDLDVHAFLVNYSLLTHWNIMSLRTKLLAGYKNLGVLKVQQLHSGRSKYRNVIGTLST